MSISRNFIATPSKKIFIFIFALLNNDSLLLRTLGEGYGLLVASDYNGSVMVLARASKGRRFGSKTSLKIGLHDRCQSAVRHPLGCAMRAFL